MLLLRPSRGLFLYISHDVDEVGLVPLAPQKLNKSAENWLKTLPWSYAEVLKKKKPAPKKEEPSPPPASLVQEEVGKIINEPRVAKEDPPQQTCNVTKTVESQEEPAVKPNTETRKSPKGNQYSSQAWCLFFSPLASNIWLDIVSFISRGHTMFHTHRVIESVFFQYYCRHQT